MINSIFSFPVEATAQPVADSPLVPTYQAAAGWIDDLFALYIFSS